MARKKVIDVNNELSKWMTNTKLFTDLFNDIEQVNDLFFGNFLKKEMASKEFAKKVWRKFPELGPEPLFDMLSQEERARSFYDNYRDHTTHQIKVFLLGLYFYEKCNILREAIDKYLEEENCILDGKSCVDSFLRIWTATALYHDIGYLLESEKIETNFGEYWNKIKEEINERLKFSLFYTKDLNITKKTERNHIHTTSIEIVNITSIAETRWFDSLRIFSEKSLLQENNNNAIKAYYDYALVQKSNERERFLDHGITSALLLILNWENFIKHLEEFRECKSTNNHGKKALQKINIIYEQRDIYKKQIEIAAGAIALHNINKKLWNDEDMVDVCLNDFCLELEGSNALPIAFLLRLVDEIQDWDREYYRPIQLGEELLEGKDFYLNIKNGKINLSYLEDNLEFRRPDSYEKGRYANLKKKLKLYLNEETINKILHYEVILNNEDNVNKKWGLKHIYSARSEAHVDYKITGFAKDSCDIIAFGLKNLRDEISDLIKESAKQGLKIRILTMQPDSAFVKQREIEEGLVENGIRNTIIELLRWIENIRGSLPETIDKKHAIQVKFYDSLPLDFYCKLDNRIYIGPYLAGKESRNIITYEFQEGVVWNLYTEYFEKLWRCEVNGIKPQNKAYIYHIQTQEQMVRQILETFCNIMVNFTDVKNKIRGIAVKYLSNGNKRKTIFFWNKAEGSQNYPEVKRSYGVVGKMDEYKCPYIHHFIPRKAGTYYFFSMEGEVQKPVQVQDAGGDKGKLKAILVAPIWNDSQEKIVGIVAFEFIKVEPLVFKKLDEEIDTYLEKEVYLTDTIIQKKTDAGENISQNITYNCPELCKLQYLLNLSKECANVLSKVIVNYMKVDEDKVFENEEYS